MSTYNTDESEIKGTTLQQRFTTLDNKKSAIYRRCEDYALWTLPSVFPKINSADAEQQGPGDSTGARAVNNLANKLIMTLFPHVPFFRLDVSSDIISELNDAAESGQDPEAKDILAIMDKELAQAERNAIKILNNNHFRTEATTAAKALLISGNSLMYYPEKDDKPVQTYHLRDYCIVRDLSGVVVEIMTRDKKAFNTFSTAEQEAIVKASRNKKYKTYANVTIYTQICRQVDGKYKLTQAADDYILPDSKATWTAEELPYIALTWNRYRGEDYGRGLVEDYTGAFHALFVLNCALVTMTGIASDIKFLVDPASVLDVVQLNNAPSGSYHTGKEGDITTPQLNKQIDMAFIEGSIQRYQQQIGQAFLMNSSVTRDAERVTAEEIRYVAQELELSHGGIYSRFAEEWQLKLAILLMSKLKFKLGAGKEIVPQIITGLDSLSRAGDLDNLRMFIMDMQLLNDVPEDIRIVIDPLKFASYVGTRRGVDYEKFTKSPDQLQQERAAQMQQQQSMVDMQAKADVSTAVAKETAKQQ
jgi:hypothetical protein